MVPETFFQLINSHIKKEWRFAFRTAFFLGLLIHLFRLTNHLLTWDSVYNFYDSQNKPELGRCFLTLSCGISSYYDLQWVNGILSLLYLSLTSICLTEIFSLKKKSSIVLVCGITMSFPVVASTFAYMYTADGYFLAQLFVSLAVLLTLKYKKGFLPGLILIAASYGSYQAYISYAVMLILAWSTVQLLYKKRSLRRLSVNWLRFLAMGGLGTALYFLCSKVLNKLEGVVASDYNGISSMALPTPQSFVSALKNCLIDFAYFFFGPLDAVNFYKILGATLFLLLALLLLHIILQNKLYRQPLRLAMALLCLAAMPFACFMIYFLSPNVRYYMLMYAGLGVIYMLPVLLYENMAAAPGKARLLLSWGCVVISFLAVFHFALIDNISYLYMVSSNEKTFQLVSRMVDRAEQLDGFEDAKKLCLVGHFDDYDTISLTLPPAMAGVRESYLISEQAHFVAMMDTYFGLTLENCSDSEREKIENSEQFHRMGHWPAKDSVTQINDTIVIKIEGAEK